MTLGLLFSYTMGVFVSWQWLAIIGAMPPTLLVVLMFFMPETPRWLLGRNQRPEALKSMQWLRGPRANVAQECYKIESNLGKYRLCMWKCIKVYHCTCISTNTEHREPVKFQGTFVLGGESLSWLKIISL